MARQRIIGEWLEIPPVASTEEMVDHLNRTIRTLVEAVERIGAFVMYRSTASEKDPSVNPRGIWDLRNNTLIPHSATSGNVEPKENEADDLGSNSYKWQKGWFKDVHVGNQLTDGNNNTTVQEVRSHIDADVPASSPHGIQPVDPSSTDTTKNKVLSNSLAKGWEDHKNTTSGNPHGVDFVELDDAPSDYTGQAGKAVVVKSTEDGLEFSSPAPDVHGNEAHDPDFLAVDGSNSPTVDIDWNSKGVYEIGYLVGTKYGYGAPPLLEPLHNILAYADKKWTVTASPAPTGNSVADMFDFTKNVPAQWDNTVTLPIEITIEWADHVNLIKAVGIQFHWNQYISGVKIEAYDNNAGAWTTLIDESNNTTNRVVWTGTLNYITKIRYTLSGTYNESVVSVANLFALSNHPSGLPYGYYLDVEGNMPMRGNLNMNSNKITNLADPTDAQDAATKNYADGKLPLDTSSAIDAYMSGNKWLSVATSGIVGLPKQSGVMVWNDTSQSISPSTTTKLELANVQWDVQNEYDTTNSRFTASEAGKYLAIFSVHWETTEDQREFQVRIHKNGSVLALTKLRTSGSGELAHIVSKVFDLAAGDYLEFYVRHEGASSHNVIVTGTSSWATVIKVA